MLHTVSKDSNVTDHGKKQAEATAPILHSFEEKGAVFWCSTLARTAQTLNAAGIEEKIVFKPVLNEWYKEEAEQWSHFLDRVDSVIGDMFTLYEKGVEYLVIAGHSLFFSVLISRIFRHDTLIVEFPNCSLSSLKIKDEGNGPRIAIYNLGDVSHIPKELQNFSYVSNVTK
jgi:broad specificity phosphatase PhoE